MSYLLNTFETFIDVNDYVLVVNNDINACNFLQMEEAYDFWQFVYVTEGALVEYSNGEPHLLKAGDIIFQRCLNELRVLRRWNIKNCKKIEENSDLSETNQNNVKLLSFLTIIL